MPRPNVWSLAVAIALAGVPAAAHHSAAAQYEVDKTISLSGEVREFRFVNPHAVVRLAVRQPDGTEAVWSAEWAPTSILRRFGLKPDALKRGDRVTIVGNPARDKTKDMLVNSITFADGHRLGLGGPPPAPAPNNNAR